ncbi:hypothetical protein GCM10010442_14620 [Kitasatospora kifunensis]
MAAVTSLSRERGGAGSALILALRQLGSAIGVAILGTLATSSYRGRLNTAGPPAPVVEQLRSGVTAGSAVARKLGSADLLASVRSSFVHGMDLTLWVCGGISCAGLLLTLAFLPGRAEASTTAGGSTVRRAGGAPGVRACAAGQDSGFARPE